MNRGNGRNVPTSPNGSVTSNYSLAYSPGDDEPPVRFPIRQQDNTFLQPRQQPRGVLSKPPQTRPPMEDYLPSWKTGQQQPTASPDATSPRSFNLKDADPMAAHLLLETAMAESAKYKILSPDELDQLKKEEVRLERNIEAGKKKLYIESRVDSTAKLLLKLGGGDSNASSTLPTPSSPVGKRGALHRLRTSITSTASSDTGSTVSTQNEAKSTKMHELAQEVQVMEKKKVELHRRKLEHTAGVLQLNLERESLKRDADANRLTKTFSFGPKDEFQFGLGIQSSPSIQGTLAMATPVLPIPVLPTPVVRKPVKASPPVAQPAFDLQPSKYLLRDGTIDGFGTENQMKSRMRAINFKMRGLWTEFDKPSEPDVAHPQPPGDAAGLAEQLSYLEDCVFSLARSYSKFSATVKDSQRRESQQDIQARQVMDSLAGMWQSVKFSAAPAQAARQLTAQSPSDRDRALSRQQTNDETFSVDAFTAKINMICARADALEKQQLTFQTQVQFEREERQRAYTGKDAEKTQIMVQLRTARDQNADLEVEIEDLQAELSKSETMLKQAQEDVEVAKRQEEEAANELAQERNAWKAREHEIATARTQQATQINMLRTANATNEAKITTLEGSEAAAKAELREVAIQIEAMGADLLAVENRSAASQKAVTDSARQLAETCKERDKLLEQIASIQNDLARSTSALVAAKEQATKHEASAKHADGHLELVATEKEDLEAEVEHLNGTITTLQKNLQNAEAQAAVERERSGETTQELGALKSTKKELEDEIERLRIQIVTLSTALQEADDRARASETAVIQKVQQISRLEAERHSLATQATHRTDESDRRIGTLEAALKEKEDHLSNLQVDSVAYTARVEAAEQRAEKMDAVLQEKTLQLSQLEAEKLKLTSEVNKRLQESGTLKSQLDSSLEAKNAELQKALRLQNEDQAKIQSLQKELNDVIAEYEELVKIEVDGEKERVNLENTIDALRNQVAELEVRLSEEKIKSMGKPSIPTTNGISVNGVYGVNGNVSYDSGSKRTPDAISIGVIRNEFRKLMKDAKAEHYKTLKMEQEERRRLETIVRSFQRDQLRPQSTSNFQGVVPSTDHNGLMSANNEIFAS